MRAGIRLVRELDTRQLPFWVNEAADSDAKFVRQYIDSIDITGCDYYAVRSTGTDLQAVGRAVDRWAAIGRDRPVWMVLQAFSWHAAHPTRTRLYPTFSQSRFMAYDALAHGAKGILYWGSTEIDRPEFRSSLYALTAELAALEPFLITSPLPGVNAKIIDDIFDPKGMGVLVQLYRDGSEFLVVLVNEDNQRHLGVDVTGLESLGGRTLKLLYGSETAAVEHEGFVTRLQPYEVKVFSTSDRYQSRRMTGRDYAQPAASN